MKTRYIFLIINHTIPSAVVDCSQVEMQALCYQSEGFPFRGFKGGWKSTFFFNMQNVQLKHCLILSPTPHSLRYLAVSGNIFEYHNGRALLASSGYKMLRNIPHTQLSTMPPHQQRNVWSKTSIMPLLKNPEWQKHWLNQTNKSDDQICWQLPSAGLTWKFFTSALRKKDVSMKIQLGKQKPCETFQTEKT